MEQDYRIVQSVRVAKALLKRGFVPKKRVKNLLDPELYCWLFERSEEFDKVFSDLLEDLRGGKRI